MKAPDTIYIPIIEEDGKKLLCTNWWETDSRSRYVNETIPYIRKDALLEWVKEQWLHTRNGTMADQIRSSAYEEMIKHIESL